MPHIYQHPGAAALRVSALWISYIHNLGQNPKGRGVSSDALRCHGGGGDMMCLIKSQEMLWVVTENRWLHPCELFAMQGFPAFDCMYGHHYPVCSFSVPNPKRTHSSVTSQVGNSTHISVVGLVWMYVCLFLERPNSDEATMQRWLTQWRNRHVGEEL